jgi:hypothetical protein
VIVLILIAVTVVQIGFLGRWLPDDRREWWSRLGAWLLIVSLACITLACLSIYGPLWVAKFFRWSAAAAAGVTAGWLLTTLVGLLAGTSDKTSGRGTTGPAPSRSRMEWVVAVAPYVAIFGIILIVATGIELVISGLAGAGYWPTWQAFEQNHWRFVAPGEWRWWLALATLGIAAATWVLSWRIDINEFSMHHLYRNRLVRCYLGASNPDRAEQVNPFTGFARQDDLRLATLRAKWGYSGPYLIVNAALNFTHGKRLAWQERKAASFIFTPLHCGFDGRMLDGSDQPGSEIDAYRPTGEYAYPDYDAKGYGGVHLGTAMAISGAAASPNMGYHTSPPMAFLMTLFNVRLGWWLGNPRHQRTWRRSGPMMGLLYLFSELFGSTTAGSAYVYLSDGGHFENLAIYELVKRRCRLIVACDAEEDRAFHFGGLGSAIRKCRTDFGAEIDIDLRPLLDRDEQGRTNVHCAVGTIRYRTGATGTLVYLKSSLVKPADHSEPADVIEYRFRAPEFPHQSTGDQFFDESQFESYRKLGQHVGERALEEMHRRGLPGFGGIQ